MLFPPQPPIPKDDQQDRERAYHREVLHDLVHLGLNTAKALERRAVDASMEGNNAVIDAAIAFERVTRAIRRTILLAEKLAEPPTRTDDAAAPKSQARTPAPGRPESASEETRPDSDPSEADEPNESPHTESQDDPESENEAEDDLADEHPDHRPIATQIAALRADLTRDQHAPPPRAANRTHHTPASQRTAQPKPPHVFVGPPLKAKKAPPRKAPKPTARQPKA